MSELTLFLIRVAYLAILWIFVLAALSVIRSDMFGARVTNASAGQPAAAPGRGKSPAARAPRRGVPTHVAVTTGSNAGVTVPLSQAPIVIGRDHHGRWVRAGGMGPLLGDEGSAFWLGREWLRATTAGEDFWPVRRLVRSADPVAGIAALAPRVLQSARRGDRRARRIVTAGQAYLAAWTRNVARRLRLARPVALSWAGSVLDDLDLPHELLPVDGHDDALAHAIRFIDGRLTGVVGTT